MAKLLKEETDGSVKQVQSGGPFMTACGAAPESTLNMPVFTPMYYGHQIVGDPACLVMPQQQFVFASPAGKMCYGYMGPQQLYYRSMPPVMNAIPVYQGQAHITHQCTGRGTEIAEKQEDGNSVNITRYIWQQNGEESKDGVSWTPIAFACCGKQSVDEGETEKVEQEEVTTEKQVEEQQNMSTEQEDPIQEQTTSEEKVEFKQPICGAFFNTCSFAVPEEYPGFGRGATNIFHLNTLFRGQTIQSNHSIAHDYEGHIVDNNINNNSWFQCWQPSEPVITTVPMVQRMPTPQEMTMQQSSRVWQSCWAPGTAFCGGRNLMPLPTQSTFGLRNLYPSQSSCTPLGTQRTVVSSAPSLMEPLQQRMQSMNLVPYPSVQQAVCPPSPKPVTFKLHAVEIHQFVPMPNMQTTKFIENAMPKQWVQNNGTQIYKHGCGANDPNSFFNPETTGMIAPMMGKRPYGTDSHHIPKIYGMEQGNSVNVERMQTQETQVNVQESITQQE
ncbi:hypothetical protein BdWA1_000826 [Babesia duncani]|uniref:Uncharacterized protein n=1 Tax=Babesia duncani TaxID=323732 RepID=A0AAD9PN42_9APIC|nr:hypothetical protein BdWA1_000826 [Babesia duncani]